MFFLWKFIVFKNYVTVFESEKNHFICAATQQQLSIAISRTEFNGIVHLE